MKATRAATAPATPRDAPLTRAPFSSSLDDAEADALLLVLVDERDEVPDEVVARLEVTAEVAVVDAALLEAVVEAALEALLESEEDPEVDAAVVDAALEADPLEDEPFKQLSSAGQGSDFTAGLGEGRYSQLFWTVTGADWTVLPVESLRVKPMEVPPAMSVFQE